MCWFADWVTLLSAWCKYKKHAVYLSHEIFQNCHFVKIKRETLFSGNWNVSFCDFGSSKVGGRLISHMFSWPHHGLTSMGPDSCACSMPQSSFCQLCILICHYFAIIRSWFNRLIWCCFTKRLSVTTLLLLKHPFWIIIHLHLGLPSGFIP